MAMIGYAASIVSIVCWILTLIKMFTDKQDGGVLKGVLGILCGLWAFIWGWMTVGKHGTKTIMLVWTVAIAVGLLTNIMAIGAAAGG
jgi:hypothetical protein